MLPKRIIAWHLSGSKKQFEDVLNGDLKLKPSSITGHYSHITPLDHLAGDDRYIFWSLVPFNKPQALFPEIEDRSWEMPRKFGFGVSAQSLIKRPHSLVRASDILHLYTQTQDSGIRPLRPELRRIAQANSMAGALGWDFVKTAFKNCRKAYKAVPLRQRTSPWEAPYECRMNYAEIEILSRGTIDLSSRLLYIIEDGVVRPI